MDYFFLELLKTPSSAKCMLSPDYFIRARILETPLYHALLMASSWLNSGVYWAKPWDECTKGRYRVRTGQMRTNQERDSGCLEEKGEGKGLTTGRSRETCLGEAQLNEQWQLQSEASSMDLIRDLNPRLQPTFPQSLHLKALIVGCWRADSSLHSHNDWIACAGIKEAWEAVMPYAICKGGKAREDMAQDMMQLQYAQLRCLHSSINRHWSRAWPVREGWGFWGGGTLYLLED